MRARWALLATIVTVLIAYGAYPYFTLFRLGLAIHSADARTLQSLIDWPAVREGIKEDVCDLVIDDPSSKGGTELAPFGASFMRGIASSSIDQAVTPEALMKAVATQPVQPETHPIGADVHVNWAFFDGLTTFLVSLHTPGQADPIKLQMQMRDGAWRVDRVWLPAELLSPGART